MSKKLTWPWSSFIPSWKVFRAISNENEYIANHIISRDSWPKSNSSVRILDLGCGDGLLIKQIVMSCNQNVSEVHLLDPDDYLLNEAEKNLKSLKIVKNILKTLGYAEEFIDSISINKDVILAVHIVYFMHCNALKKIFFSIPRSIPIFVVIDDSTSIFTKIWKISTPKYFKRSIDSHKIIKNLPSKNFSVKKTTFLSYVPDPFFFRDEIRNQLISMLAYADFDKLLKDKKDKICRIIKENENSKKVVCRNICYEIIKK